MRPPGDANATNFVDVIPLSDERVNESEVLEGAIQVQKRVAQTPASPEGPAQESETSPRTGQHVTVVIVETPLVSWHASTYPEGQKIPGEKYAVGDKLAPGGKQEVMGSTMNKPFVDS